MKTKVQPHPVEIGIAALSALSLLCLIIYLVHRGVSVEDGVAQLTATVEHLEQRPVGYIAHIRVDNIGDKTAAAAVIEGVAGSEIGEIQFDYVPAGSVRRGAMQFRADPVQASGIELTVKGYSEP